MNNYEPNKILNELEQAREPALLLEPMVGDRWLLASAMQKAIRRGESERATRAALGLWQQNRRKFWDRLLVIALEDIGCGGPDVLVRVLTAIAASTWRRRVGDIQGGLHLTHLLCGAVKSRLADAVFIQAEKAARYADTREQFATASAQILRRCMVDKELPLIERALAAWFLAGTKKFPSELMPQRTGTVDKAIAAMRATHTQEDLTEACIGVLSRTPWPLALHIPLIHQEAQRQPTAIRHHAIPATPDIDGLPCYAADMFTRVGKACYRELQRTVVDLQAFTTQQIGLGIFYLDGGKVDKELTAPGLDAIQRAGEMADLESAGLAPAAYDDLQHTLRDSMGLLANIRQNHLRRHLKGGTR